MKEMKQIIKAQLDECKIADLSHYDESTNSYFIPKRTSIIIKVDSTYIINIKKTMLIPNIINNNWNAGSVPPFNCCKAVVTEYMKNMIKIDGFDYDIVTKSNGSKIWSGWLPLSEIEIVEKV